MRLGWHRLHHDPHATTNRVWAIVGIFILMGFVLMGLVFSKGGTGGEAAAAGFFFLAVFAVMGFSAALQMRRQENDDFIRK
jgi:hypothetical protein